jgi:hypothetical protein
VGRDSVVLTANRFGLDGSGIESNWGCGNFPLPSRLPWGPPSLQYNGYWVIVGGRAAEERLCHSPPSSAKVPMLKKEYSYTSTPPLGLRDLF